MIHFTVETDNVHAHLFSITLKIKQPCARQRVSLPAWIPGSYLVREFSKNLQGLGASQRGRTVAIQQLDKATWMLDCVANQPLELRYQVYALDNSVRTAWLDAARGFFNGTSLFLRIDGQTNAPHQVQIKPPRKLPQKSQLGAQGWQLATGLRAVKVNPAGFGLYQADDYDELVDCPVEMGPFWSGSFKACGIAHRFVVAGAPPTFDGARLLADTQKICEAEIKFWHGAGKPKPPFKSYLFMLNAVDDGYGGLEHRNSTALICNRKDLPRSGSSAFEKGKLTDGYTTLLGLISHEYFHTWNVKRLRPAEFAQYNYAAENYTQLLWFFEGFTSYFDDLLLRRANLIDDSTYLKLLTKTINQVLQTPGRKVQSVAQASFDAWIKYYRQDENTPNTTVSYYTKGSLVALCLDLSLRAEGKTTLDAVMRALWRRSKAGPPSHGGPMTEADLLATLEELTGRSYATELAVWVHSTDDMPLEALLLGTGVGVLHEPSQLAQALGLRVAEGTAVQIKNVLRGGAAEAAGFAAGDEWFGIEVDAQLPRRDKSAPAKSGWRISKLDDVTLYAGTHTRVNAWVARDKRLLSLPLALPKAETTWRLVAREPKLVAGWLGG